MWMICPQAWLTNLASTPSCWQRKTWWSKGNTTRRRGAAKGRTTRRTVTTRSVRKENAKVQTEVNQIHNFCFKLSHLGMFESLSKLKKNSPRLKLEIVYMISCDTIFDNFSCFKEFGRPTLHTITSSILRLFHTQRNWWVNIVTWTTLIQPLLFFRFLWVCVQQQQEWRAGAALWLLSKETPFRV